MYYCPDELFFTNDADNIKRMIFLVYYCQYIVIIQFIVPTSLNRLTQKSNTNLI